MAAVGASQADYCSAVEEWQDGATRALTDRDGTPMSRVDKCGKSQIPLRDFASRISRAIVRLTPPGYIALSVTYEIAPGEDELQKRVKFWCNNYIDVDVIRHFIDSDDVHEDEPHLLPEHLWPAIATERIEIEGARCLAETLVRMFGQGRVLLLGPLLLMMAPLMMIRCGGQCLPWTA